MHYSFRVIVVPGQPPAIAEVSGSIPPGVYQVSGHDNRAEATPSEQVAVSIMQHDADGAAVVGATGYLGA